MTVRIAQLTDIHVETWAGLRLRDLFSKRLTGLVNSRLLRRARHRREILGAAVERVIEERPDLCVVTGDLTNVGTRAEVLAARALLAPIDEAGIPLRVIPGNHDYYVAESTCGQFEDVLATWVAADARVGAWPYPYVVRVGPVSVLMVRSALPTAPLLAYGRVGAPALKRLRALGRAERDAGQQVVVCVHHHPSRAPHKRLDAPRNLRDARAFRAACVEIGATLVLHGHNHFAEAHHIAEDPELIVVGLSSSSTTRADRAERLGQVGLYTWDGARWRLQVSELITDEGRFGPWRDVPVQEHRR